MVSATGSFGTTGSIPKKKAKKRKAIQKAKPSLAVGEKLQTELGGLVVTVFSILLLLSLISFSAADVDPAGRASGEPIRNWIGPVGGHLAQLVSALFGVGAFALNALMMAVGVRALYGKPVEVSKRTFGLIAMLLASGAVLVHIAFVGTRVLGGPAGGLIGAYVGEGMKMLISTAGTFLVSSTVFLTGLVLLTGRSLSQMATAGARFAKQALSRLRSVSSSPEASEARKGEDGMEHTVAHKGPVIRINDAVPGLMEDEQKDTSESLLKDKDTASGQGQGSGERDFSDSSQDVDDTVHAGAPLSEADGKTEPQVQAVNVDLGELKGADVESASPSKTKEVEAQVEPKIVESDAMRRSRGQQDLVAGQQKSLPLEDVPKTFELPPLSFLNYEPPNSEAVSRNVLTENARVLEEKLHDFGVKGNVVEIHPGPVVTMYEFKPAPGVKISRIANLADDLSMALAALRVRIVAPIPGKSVVGIEVPNKAREIVYMKEILSDDGFQNSKMKVPLAIGKDIVGYPVVEDMAKMPHLLVAGATGAGKSVAINSFICSILYRSTPEDVRMIMVDPKMLELSPYEGIPHLMLPVVTDPKQAALALKWAVAEMERRYRMMADTGVRNIIGYNNMVEKLRADHESKNQDVQKRVPRSIVLGEEMAGVTVEGTGQQPTSPQNVEIPEKLPYIVIIIDELADLMMVASKDVETSIARLAQMARAAGLHLVIATQRPSVDVITGLIKANFPARMSFRVSSKIDSRTILDSAGAENLLGMGDMLFMPPGSSSLRRVHGAFVSDSEVASIVEHLKEQGKPDYCMEILEESPEEGGEAGQQDYDEFYDQAVAIVAESRKASISYLQRRLKIGYNRAARIIEVMEMEGVIGPAKSSGGREIFVNPM